MFGHSNNTTTNDGGNEKLAKPTIHKHTTKSKTSSREPRISGTSTRVGLTLNPESITISISKPVKYVCKNALKCCTWNIRRGLVTREPELRILLKSEDIDVIFLTETDTKNIVNEDSYKIEGYKTILPLKSISNNLTRILCLVKENLVNAITVRADLMNEEFPSIWIEYKQERKKSTLLAGFYRVWTQEGDKTHGEQLARIN